MTSTSKEFSTIYGIDFNGKVWTVTYHFKSTPTWTLLHNPTNIYLKRISSFPNGILWGISSDRQIYIYVVKQDLPIRVRVETFENQRWNPLDGFCDHLLPTDRQKFSNIEGTEERTKDSFKLPSTAWEWETNDWQLEKTLGSEVLEEHAWTYSIDFPATYSGTKSWKSCVRRRKWFRFRRYIGTNKWQKVDGLFNDFTKEPFVDICVGSFGTHKDLSCVWSLSINGKVYFREGITPLNPEGTNWKEVPIKKGLEACQITLASGHPLIVSWTGNFLYRVGLAANNLIGTEWVEGNGPPNGLLQLSAGEETIWAVSRDKKCWALKGSLQSILNKNKIDETVVVFEWIEIPYGNIKSISVSQSDQVVLALTNEEIPKILIRFGISKDQKLGQGWRDAFPGITWDTISSASSEASVNSSFSIQSGGGGHDLPDSSTDTDSLKSLTMSIKPDLPQLALPINEVDDKDNDAIGGGGAVSLCWVDGNCASFITNLFENELEIGPWREQILGELQSNRAHKDFKYPNAIENEGGSWTAKSVNASMLRHNRKGATWMKGQLEISNNDTLIFYKNHQSAWMCAIRDVLSCILSSEIAFSFTLRIRNAIEAGNADFISLKFQHEIDMEEWRLAMIQLGKDKSEAEEECLMGNIWSTTTAGEIHSCSLVKMGDTPIDTDIYTPSLTGEMKMHYPLLKGFMSGTLIKMDLSVPSDSKKFSINLNGRDPEELVAFHFNPRVEDKVIVRNTKEKGVWGEEERDGNAIFVPGMKYNVTLECGDSHIFTTVAAKHKFIIKYKHRVQPKFIASMTLFGEINVISIRYDPKLEESKQTEFISQPVSGHFWRVESSSQGAVWAIGYDLNVWVSTFQNTLLTKSIEGPNHIVTDEKNFYIFENQRWNPLSGFSDHGLPTDRQNWTDETGRIPLDKDNIKVPSNKWAWVTDWEIDYNMKGGTDEEGFQYAVDFPASYHKHKRINDFVRRRRYTRTCRHSVPGPWTNIPNTKLVDISIRMSNDCNWEVLGVCENGDLITRVGISDENLAGTHWDPIPSNNQFISISGAFKCNDWAIGKDGFSYIRYGEKFQMLDHPPDTPLKSIRVGAAGVWAIGTNNTLYRRTEVKPHFPEGKDWIKVIDGISQVSLSPDGNLYALIKRGQTFNWSLAKRVGINQNNLHGLGWEILAEGPWSSISLNGIYAKNN